LLTAFISSVIILLGFSIYFSIGNTLNLNADALDAMISIRFDKGDAILGSIALLEKTIVIVTFFFTVFGFLVLKRQRRAAKYWLILSVLTTLIAVSSHPSHAIALYTALFGYLAVIVAERWSDARTWIYTTAIVSIMLICFADLYLAIHSFTAVIGGILLGFCTLLGVVFFYRRRYTLPVPATGLLLIFVSASLLISWGGAYYRYYPSILEQYTPLLLPPTVLHKNTWWSSGHSAQSMYVQWAGSLKSIERELQAAGWAVVPKADFSIIVNRIAAKNRYEQLPLFPKIYLNRKAVLIMTRKIGNPERLLVLRLWDANILLDRPLLPVWLGIVEYHKPWQAPAFLKTKKKPVIEPALPPATEVLMQALTNFSVKTIPTSEGSTLLMMPRSRL
ncbi:MAG: LssY C-terminal domain-containing protein, partial [Gammaproteobacteria bacterium]